jgi:molecular chaperone Hsp33
LGEFIAASVLLASNLKFEGRLVLQLRSDSDISLLMAECKHNGEVRAYAQYNEKVIAENKDKNFSFEMFRKGLLAMTIEPEVGESYQGIVSLSGKDGGEAKNLAVCLQNYFAQSEQLQSHFYLLSAGDFAVGFMLQQLPAQLEPNEQVRALHWEDIQYLAATLSEEELLTLDGQTIMHRLFHEDKVRFLDQSPIKFACSCSKERMDSALISLGRNELETILLEQGQIDMLCEFCKYGYVYGQTEINNLFSDFPPEKILH